MKAKKERIFYYDFLRALAIIAVLMCHVDLFFGPLNTPLETIFHQAFHDFGRVGVPLFLMISGALLLNRDYELPEFLKKRFARIIYPFVFWVALIIIGIIVTMKDYAFAWNTFIGNPSITWYFWMLIGVYLAIPVLNTFIKEYGLKGCEYFLIVWFITIVLMTFNSYPLFPDFNLDFFASYVGYPVLGYYLDKKEFGIDDLKVAILGLAIFVISLASFVYIHYTNLNLTAQIYLNVPIVFMGIGIYLFIKYIDRITSFRHVKDNIIGKAIAAISLASYGMYFSHVLVLKVLLMFNPESTLLMPVMFVLLVFFSWLLPYIVSKMPYLKIFSGL